METNIYETVVIFSTKIKDNIKIVTKSYTDIIQGF